jgi:two-component system, cell cycle sensor histidine kinase and response regulator CckA
MNDERKTKSQLIEELQKTRRALRKAEKAPQGNTGLAEFRRSIRVCRKSEEQYRTIVDHLSEGIVVTRNGQILFVNRRCLNFLGYSDLKEVTDKSIHSFIHPDDVERVATYALNRQKGGFSPSTYEFKCMKKDGTSAHLRASVAPMMFSGEIASLVNLFDITESKKAEEALQVAEIRYRNIFENTGTVMLIVEEDMTISLANNEFEKLTGYRREEVEGKKKWTEFVHQSDLEKMVKQHKLRRSDPNQAIKNYEFRLVCRDGGLRNILLTVDVIPGTMNSIASLLDITDRTYAEQELRKSHTALNAAHQQLLEFDREIREKYQELANSDHALRQSEEKYRQIFENAIEGIHQTTPEGKYLSVNPAFARMFGYSSPQEMIDSVTDIGQQTYVNPTDRKYLVERLRKEDKIEGFEVERLRKDGSKFWMLMNIHTVRDDKGDILHFEGTNVDITERKLTEDALRQSEEKYRILAENVSDIIWSLDMDLKFTYISPSAERLQGWTVEEWKTLRLDDILTPESLERVRKALEEELSPAATPIRTRTIEVEEYRKDGSTVWIEVTASPLLDQQGRFVGITGVSRDISERRRTQEALKQSETRFRMLFEKSPYGISIARNGITLYANDACLKMFGYDHLSEHTGTSQLLRVAPESRAYIMDRFVRRSHGEAITDTFEFVGLRKDGSTFPLFGQVISIQLDDGPATVSFFQDLTERKRVEEILRENELLLQEMQKIARLGGWKANPQTDYLKWSEGIYNIVEAPRDYTPGLAEGMKYYPPEYISIIRDNLNRCLEEGHPFAVETELITDTGKRLWTEVRGLAPLTDGQRSYVLGTLQDITTRKNAEMERKALEERLNRAEKMEALGMLAGGVAHDLNNVLGILIGYSELLAEEIEPSSPLRPHVEYMKQGGVRAAAIVQDLLTLARRGVQTEEIIDLNSILDSVQESPEFQKIASFHPGVHMNTIQTARLLNIKGSSVHLRKTILNLVSNASEAMPAGGCLTIKTDNQYLEKPVPGYDDIQEGDYVVLSVVDTGEGISESDMKRIFEPFYTKKIMGRSGTGLGLAVVWGTVKDHKGYINVQSEPGKGTTFTLYFPATREEAPREQGSLPKTAYMGNRESILVVDDVQGQRELAARMLSKLNYDVQTVSSGEAAVQFLKMNDVDLVVLDMIMDPGMDGLDTYREILKTHPGQKAIIVSGFSESDRVRQAQTLGAGAYIRKPYMSEILGMAVRKELNKQAA